jgi:hypothetical protein
MESQRYSRPEGASGLAAELAGRIPVFFFSPGLVHTDMPSGTRDALVRRYLHAEHDDLDDCAASPVLKHSFTTGQRSRSASESFLAGETRIVSIEHEEFHGDEGGHPNVPACGGLQPILPERRLFVQKVLELVLWAAVFWL